MAYVPGTDSTVSPLISSPGQPPFDHSPIHLPTIASTCFAWAAAGRRYTQKVEVCDVIKLLEGDGWFLVRIRGRQRHFPHPTKAGTVTVSGKASADLPPGTLRSALKQAGLLGKEGEQ